MNGHPRTILIVGGRVYDHDGDTDRPPVADILISGARIERVEAGLAETLRGGRAPDETIDARDRLIVPGFVNAHYHSHDVLLKGSFEAIPLQMWFVNAVPAQYPRRSKEEIRARTLLGAAECLRAGITTVQDMLSVHPLDEEHLDTVVAAYEEIGIRLVLSLQIGDLRAIDRIPFWKDTVPAQYHAFLGGAVAPSAGEPPLEWVKRQYLRLGPSRPRQSWALSPTSGFMSSPALLGGIAQFSADHGLPVFTHIYESRPEALGSRMFYGEHGGSQVGYLRAMGLLGPRLGLAHGIWMRPDEIDMLAETGTNAVLNPTGNLKTRSGVAPIRRYLEAGVPLGLGCDNCSASDVQNMFQAMRLLAGLGAISDPEPGGPTAADAMRIATAGSARALGLGDQVGAIKPGMKADLVLLDLSQLSFVPLNSAARQMVFSETGAAVDTVLVDGRAVVKEGRLATIDEGELRDAVEAAMHALRKDRVEVQGRYAQIYPYLVEALRRTWREDVGVERYLPK